MIIFVPNLIFAHGSQGSGFMAGFTHPILGIDHNMAILGSGFLGYFLNQKKWYLASLTFIAAMVIGGFMGVDKEATLAIEKVIAFSVVSIGIVIAFRNSLPPIFVLTLLFVFGYFHGFAHGAEMPDTSTILKYIPGYTVGAILLGSLGFFIGLLVYFMNNYEKYIMLASGIMIGCGTLMLLS